VTEPTEPTEESYQAKLIYRAGVNAGETQLIPLGESVVLDFPEEPTEETTEGDTGGSSSYDYGWFLSEGGVPIEPEILGGELPDADEGSEFTYMLYSSIVFTPPEDVEGYEEEWYPVFCGYNAEEGKWQYYLCLESAVLDEEEQEEYIYYIFDLATEYSDIYMMEKPLRDWTFYLEVDGEYLPFKLESLDAVQSDFPGPLLITGASYEEVATVAIG
jgi:hypothetical protein